MFSVLYINNFIEVKSKNFKNISVVVIYTLLLETPTIYVCKQGNIKVIVIGTLCVETHTVYACTKFANISVVGN